MESIFSQALANSSTQLTTSAGTTIIRLLSALLLGVFIAQVYRHVHRGVSYSQSYAFSIVMMAMIVTLVMLVIGSNLARAFTLLGAFTIIRYRTAVKDPKDTAFIFLALVTGLALGSGDYIIAFIGVPIIGATALVLNTMNFGALVKLEQILYLTVDPKKLDQKDLEAILFGLFKSVSVINVNYNSSRNLIQYSYNVKLIKRETQSDAIDHLVKLKGVVGAELLSSQQVVEF